MRFGCAAAELYVTPGGEVGSIGVWQAHFDYTQALGAEGVAPTLISAGKYKVEGNPYAPLDAEAQGFMQSRR
jgi:ClpP class serine protease